MKRSDRIKTRVRFTVKEPEVAVRESVPPMESPVSVESVSDSPVQVELPPKGRESNRNHIRRMIRENPRDTIRGQDAKESFDQFRSRVLPLVHGYMQELAHDPTAKIGIPSHPQAVKLVRAWIDNGTPDDYSVHPVSMASEDTDAPGSVSRIFPSEAGDWEMHPVDISGSDDIGPGIHFVRHGEKPWNREQSDRAGSGQRALGTIMDRVGKLDFARARQVAADALLAGHLTEEDIGKAIDAALPSNLDDLPNHHMLAVISASSPTRRSKYSDKVRERFADLSSASPDAQQLLGSHLAQLGLG